jgi:hypothetical protein
MRSGLLRRHARFSRAITYIAVKLVECDQIDNRKITHWWLVSGLFNDSGCVYTVQRRKMEMIDEWERIWKEVVVTYSRYRPGICLEVLRETTYNLSEDITSLGQDSKRGPTKYESRALPLHSQFRNFNGLHASCSGKFSVYFEASLSSDSAVSACGV